MPEHTNSPETGPIVAYIQGQMPPRLAIICFSHNPHYREFCVTREVCNVISLYYEKPYLGPLTADDFNRAPLEVTGQLLERLLLMPGIECVELQPYRICLYKGLAFEWSDFIDRIYEVIAEVVYPEAGEDGMEVWEQDASPMDESEAETRGDAGSVNPKRAQGDDHATA
jgi:hypothetical protein